MNRWGAAVASAEGTEERFLVLVADSVGDHIDLKALKKQEASRCLEPEVFYILPEAHAGTLPKEGTDVVIPQVALRTHSTDIETWFENVVVDIPESPLNR